MEGLNHFFSDIHFADNDTYRYDTTQIGGQIHILRKDSQDWGDADVIIIGCGEQRGAGYDHTSFAPDVIRQAFYQLFYWHNDIKLADAGNIILGEDASESIANLSNVLLSLYLANKKVIILGGSHDITLAQYKAFQKAQKLVNACVIDAYIDLKDSEMITDQSFLMDMLTGRNNFVRQYTHIGFQSYAVNPMILQTLDKLRFDCVRLGQVKESIDTVEPELRSCNMLSIDMNAIRASEVPYIKTASPNGFFFDEMCGLIKAASMNEDLHSVGIYGYLSDEDENEKGAVAISQMLWYYLDGIHAQFSEINISEIDLYEQHYVQMNGELTLFLKSPRTQRWWMKVLNDKYIPCSYQDYVTAANNDIPERWFRYHERIL